MSTSVHRLRLAAIADGSGASLVRPLVELRLRSGLLPCIRVVPDAPTTESPQSVRDLGRFIVIPALVNAHTHLDLSHVGPLPYDADGGFVGWIDCVRASRLTEPADIRASVRLGVEKLVAGGVIAVGDIAGGGRFEPFEVLAGSPLRGVSFIEIFGVGQRQDDAVNRMRALSDRLPDRGPQHVRLGLQPHAPYSAGLRVYQAATECWQMRRTPLATHLAESAEERTFIGTAKGPLRHLLERLGVWDDSVLADLTPGQRPIGYLDRVLREAPWLAAHVNDCTDAELETLADSRVSVAYCPRGAAYFHRETESGPHRYREMISMGINVTIGTDSVINIPPAESDCLSTLDEMRFLWRRDRADTAMLLQMATINGAQALCLPESEFQFGEAIQGDWQQVAGLIAIDVHGTDTQARPLRRILESEARPVWLAHPEIDRLKHIAGNVIGLD